MSDRGKMIDKFLVQHGWAGATKVYFESDASFRRYIRLSKENNTTVLMDAELARDTVKPFLKMAKHLSTLGYSVPLVIAEDCELGLILMEDLGSSTFGSLLQKGKDELALYFLATDLLIDLHKKPLKQTIPKDLPLYEQALLLGEANLLLEWFVPAVLGNVLPLATAHEYAYLWRIIIDRCTEIPLNLVLRDYHIDNLIHMEKREGIKACGLVDFQDAVKGPVTYDLVSLVEDARRDVSVEVARAVKQRYLAAFPKLDPEKFELSMAVLGAQRHVKVIGIFTRLWVRDKKPAYLAHIARVWQMLEVSCQHAALKPIKNWLDIHLPYSLRHNSVNLK